MSRLVIQGGNKINGELSVYGSKNAVLPILAATVLNGGVNILKNCPMLKDVEIMFQMLRELGCSVVLSGDTAIVDSKYINSNIVNEELAAELRSSIFLLGPLLSRFGKVTISHPGECEYLWSHLGI